MTEVDEDVTVDFWVYPLQFGERLANHDWFPFHGHQFLASSFVSRAIAAGRRDAIGTALILWTESMRLDPAGTLPDDDIELAQLAKFGLDVAGWQDVRPFALHGWRPCHVERLPDGQTRLGHRVIAEVCHEMATRKRGRDAARSLNRRNQKRSRLRKQMASMRLHKSLQESEQVIEGILDFLDQEDLYIVPDNINAGLVAIGAKTSNIHQLAKGFDA
ncbi:MAG: DUF1376 domain-containing protein [Pseudomonadota bacterium]